MIFKIACIFFMFLGAVFFLDSLAVLGYKIHFCTKDAKEMDIIDI